MIEIRGIKSLNTDNIFWLIIGADKNVVVVDPGEAKPIMDYIEECSLKPDSIIITHEHPDHIGGIQAIVDKFQCPVLGPKNESIESVTHPMAEGNSFERIGIKFEVLALPGHTSSHIGFIVNNEHFFCGDTILGGGCGKVPESAGNTMLDSLRKCMQLYPQMKLYWGHELTEPNLLFAQKVEPDNQDVANRLKLAQENISTSGFDAPGTLSEELKTNPFLRIEHADVVLSVEEKYSAKLSTSYEVFAALLQWKSEG
ncbi:MAG: hydroxyacylglutathione hydrolase [Gammaproteobacteria bacterium]|nr:hydroxyacylglutathione hydrolase [Gammaproteobacteria bacterium]